MHSRRSLPALRIPEFAHDSNGKPVIEMRPESLYG